VEGTIRGVAVGRKNYLFAGSYDGARRAATIYSLVESCRAAGVEPYAYFADALARTTTPRPPASSRLAPGKPPARRRRRSARTSPGTASFYTERVPRVDVDVRTLTIGWQYASVGAP